MTGVSEITSRSSFRKRERVLLSPTRRIWAKYILVILIYAVVFNFWQVEPVPGRVHLVGIIIAAISVWPLARWYAKETPGLPMFELICLAYGLQFAIPLYLQFNQAEMRGGHALLLTWDQTLRATSLVVLGLSSLIAAYYFTSANKLMGRVPKLDLPISPRSRIVYFIVTIAVGLGFILLRMLDIGPVVNSRLGAFVSLLSSQSYIAIALLAYQRYQSQKPSNRTKLILYLSVSVFMLLGLTTGGLENTLVPIVIWLIVRWHMTRKMPWKLLMAGFILFVFVLQPVKNAYRTRAWLTINTPSLVERVNLWARLSEEWVVNLAKGDVLTEGESVLRQSMQRLDLLHQFVLIQELTPDTVPYYYGETYSYLMYAWIPRLVWPEKPIAQQSNITLALDYGLLYDEQVDKTMTGFSHLAEAYANFGILGIVVIMMLQGGVLALIDMTLNGRESEGGRAVYVSIMVFFLNGIGSSTAGIFGGIVQGILVSAVILKLLDVSLRFHHGSRKINTTLAATTK